MLPGRLLLLVWGAFGAYPRSLPDIAVPEWVAAAAFLALVLATTRLAGPHRRIRFKLQLDARVSSALFTGFLLRGLATLVLELITVLRRV
jgi:hypothetical protein